MTITEEEREKAKKDGWIFADEEQPKEDGEYLVTYVCFRACTMEFCYMRVNRFILSPYEKRWAGNEKIVAWRPLPALAALGDQQRKELEIEEKKRKGKGYWMEKVYLEMPLPGFRGYRYEAMLNIQGNSREELPKEEDIKGSFWAERTEEGWHGKFVLDGEEPSDENQVFSSYYGPKPIAADAQTRFGAEAIIRSIEPLQSGIVPRFEARIEGNIKASSIHFFPYED